MSRAPVIIIQQDLHARASWAEALIQEGDVRGPLLQHSITRHAESWQALLSYFDTEIHEDNADDVIAWLEPFLDHWPPSLRAVPEAWCDTLLIEGVCPDAVELCRALDLSDTALFDLDPIAFLDQIQDLNLARTELMDITPISDFFDLQVLDLSETPVEDLGPLSSLTNLRYLDLNDTAIDDVEALGTLRNLRYLDLSDTKVEDITPLAQLNALEQLYISDTRVDDIGPLQKLLNRGLWLVS